MIYNIIKYNVLSSVVIKKGPAGYYVSDCKDIRGEIKAVRTMRAETILPPA